MARWWATVLLSAGASVEADIVLTAHKTTTTLPPMATRTFEEFPTEVTLTEAAMPSPILPILISGSFQTVTDGAVVLITTGKVVNMPVDGQTEPTPRGMVLRMDSLGRLELSVSHESESGFARARSQQTRLGAGLRHNFRILVNSESIQVVVDGLFGPRVLRKRSTCSSSDPEPWCTFTGTWRDGAKVFVGGSGSFRSLPNLGGNFRGRLELGMRRLTAGEEPRPTALDGQDDDDADVELSSESTASGNSDTLFLILIPTLLAILGIIAALGIWLWCTFGEKSRKTQPAPLAVSGQTPPTALGKSPSAGPQVPTAVAAPMAGRQVPAAAAAPTGGQHVVSSAAALTVAASKAPAVTTADEVADVTVLNIATEPELPTYPPWWTARPTLGKSELVPVSNATRRAVQALMDSTWRDIVTRDRAKTPGGRSVAPLQVVQVNRNENLKLWQEYALRRNEIGKKMKEQDDLEGVLTAEAGPDLGAREPGSNEFLLWHGTKPSACASICQSDFLLKLAGSHRGTLYGDGLYFAESVSKSDEYADDDKEGPYKGLYAMLLCRVTLGKALYTDEVRPDGTRLRNACVGSGAEYDSVLGDREKARGTYREFVVYNSVQAYPEYVVIYRRESDATE